MTFRLLPKDVRFFELFVADGENLREAAARLHEMVSTYENIDEHVVEIQRLEKAGDRDRPRDQPQARGRVHHAVRSGGHPRAHRQAR